MRAKSTMRRCFCHTDLGSKCSISQFFNTQGHRSTRGLLISETVQKISKITYTASQPVLTFDKRQICEEILKELRFNVIKNLLSLFFTNGFITMCNLKKRLIRSAFWVLLQAMFLTVENKRKSDENYTFETTNNQ